MKNLILSFCLFSTVGFFPTDADARMRTLSGKTVYTWDLKKSDLNVRLRGVSVFSSRIVWVSGDKGSYARSIDGGATWQKGVVPGAEDLDFRDIEAQGAEIALVLSIGNGDKSRIYKTTDGGKSWTMTFRNQTPGAFFDAMAFWDHRRGIAISDPVDGHFLIIRTEDGGNTWTSVPSTGVPQALEGEGAFASSGTCITTQTPNRVWFGTGGPRARIFYSEDGGSTWSVTETPIKKGKTSGIFSIVFDGKGRGVAVGGDYTKEADPSDNVALSDDWGRTWYGVTGNRPAGYRSCVVSIPGTGMLLAVGPAGTEYSVDHGKTWLGFQQEGFHSVCATGRDSIWAVGENGKIGRYALGPRRHG